MSPGFDLGEDIQFDGGPDGGRLLKAPGGFPE
jgi:hypothetical protein